MIEQSYILVCVVPIPSQEGDRAVIYTSMCGACIQARKVIEQSYILVCVVPVPSQEGDRAVIYTSMCGACTKPGR